MIRRFCSVQGAALTPGGLIRPVDLASAATGRAPRALQGFVFKYETSTTALERARKGVSTMIGLLLIGLLLILLFGGLGFAISPLFFVLLIILLVVGFGGGGYYRRGR